MYLKMVKICRLLVWKAGVSTLLLPRLLERTRIDLRAVLKNFQKTRSKKLRRRLLWSGLVDLPLICKTGLSSSRSRKPKLKHRMRLSLSPVYIYLMKRVVTN